MAQYYVDNAHGKLDGSKGLYQLKIGNYYDWHIGFCGYAAENDSTRV